MAEKNINQGNILVIDDEEVICSLIKDTLSEKGYSVTTTQDAKEGLQITQQNSFDAILIDLRMPDLDGLTVLEKIRQYDPDNTVIMITGYPSFETVKEALHLGAFDYLPKPFDLEALLFTIIRAIGVHRLNIDNRRLLKQISEENIILEKKVIERTEDLRSLYRDLQTSYMRTIKAMVATVMLKDHYTYGHSEKVSKCAIMIAQEMRLSVKEIDEIKEACELHDLSKVGLSDYILNKPDKLSPQEWEEVKRYQLNAKELLGPLEFLHNVRDLICQHHERYDGSGYPYGLREEAIKIGARIMAVADAYVAMTSERPYRKTPFSKEEAIEEIKKNSRTQFDPGVVEAFLKTVDKL